MSLHVLPPMTRVRGTHVWLPRPDGFVDTPQFPGWVTRGVAPSSPVSELPDPYSSASSPRGSPPSKRHPRRIRLLTHESLRVGVHEGLLLHVEQEQWSILFDKWMAVFGDARGSVMVVASCRAERAPELSSSCAPW